MNELMRNAMEDAKRAGRRYRLASPRRTAGGGVGVRLGQRAGASLEFRDHRDYQPGDDPRWIDWSAYARSEQLVVKLYREEVHPHVDVLVDVSRSMAPAPGRSDSETSGGAKPQAARGLAAAIEAAAENEGFTHAVYAAGARCELMRDERAEWAFDHAGTLGEALGRMPPRWRSGGVRVVISDLLFGDEPDAVMQRVAHGAAAVFVVQVLGEADANPPERGNVRLVDCETEQVREIFIDAAAQRRYLRDLTRHQQHWSAAVRRVGGVMTTLIAEELAAEWDLRELARVGLLVVE